MKIEYTDMTPEQFAAKMKGFTENLNNLFEQSRELEVQIKCRWQISNMKFNYLKIKDVCDFVGGSQPPKSQFIYVSKPGYVRLIQTRDYKTDAFPTYIPISSTKKFCDEFDIMIGRYGPPIFKYVAD